MSLGLVESDGPRSLYQRISRPAADSSLREAIGALLLGILLVGTVSYGVATSTAWWAVPLALVDRAVGAPLVVRSGRRILVRPRP